jgi:hypothetical protein
MPDIPSHRNYLDEKSAIPAEGYAKNIFMSV